jgi:anti-sigma factor RsiW
MRTCSFHHQDIALLAVGSLSDEEQQSLRDHLAVCSDCRQRLHDYAAIASRLTAAGKATGLEASEDFHRNFTRALLAERRRPAMAWPVLAVAATVVFGLWVTIQPAAPPNPRIVAVSTPVPAKHDQPAAFVPTLANYEAVVHQSPDRLDELLRCQPAGSTASVPTLTASCLALRTD